MKRCEPDFGHSTQGGHDAGNFYDAMNRNGSPEPTFETDDERTYFLAVLPVHPEMKERGRARGHAGGQVAKNK